MINKNMKNIKNIVNNCPRSFNQNIKELKDFHEKMDNHCYNLDSFAPCRAFVDCRKWKKRLNCWLLLIKE